MLGLVLAGGRQWWSGDGGGEVLQGVVQKRVVQEQGQSQQNQLDLLERPSPTCSGEVIDLALRGRTSPGGPQGREAQTHPAFQAFGAGWGRRAVVLSSQFISSCTTVALSHPH